MYKYFIFILFIFSNLHGEVLPLKEYKDSLYDVLSKSDDTHEKFKAKKKLLDLHWYESKSKAETFRFYEDLALELELNEEWDLAMESLLSLYMVVSSDFSSQDNFFELYAKAKEKYINKIDDETLLIKCLEVDLNEAMFGKKEPLKSVDEILQEMKILASEIGTDKAEGIYLFSTANYYSITGDLDKSLEFYLELLPILESNAFEYEPWLEKSLVYNNVLDLMSFCDTDFGEKMIEKSIAYNEKIGQKLGIVANYSTLAKIYANDLQFKKSNEYAKKTIRNAKKINSQSFEVTGLGIQGFNYLDMGDYPRSEKLFREALFQLNILDEAYNAHAMRLKMGLARALTLQKKLKELKLLDDDFEAMLQNEKNTTIFMQLDALYFKMCYTALKGNYAESKKYLDELIPLAKSLNDNELISKVYLDWSKFCKDFGKLNEAYEYVSLATNYKDSANIDLVKHKLKLKKLEYRYTNALAVRKVKSKDSPHFSLSKFSLGFNWTTTILLLLLSGVITFIYLGVKRNKSLVHELSTAQGKLELTAQSLNEALQFSNNQFLNNSERLKSKLKIEDDLSKSTLKNNRLLTLNTVREMDLARENMQVFSSLAKGDIVVKPDPVSLNSILNKVGSEVLEANPEFKFHHKIANHCEIFVDKDQIELVLRNLAYLAVYRSNGEGRLDIIASENAESHILEIDEYCERLPEELIAWYSDPKIQELENFPFKMELTVVRYLLKKNRAKLLVDVGPSGNNLLYIFLPKKKRQE